MRGWRTKTRSVQAWAVPRNGRNGRELGTLVCGRRGRRGEQRALSPRISNRRGWGAWFSFVTIMTLQVGEGLWRGAEIVFESRGLLRMAGSIYLPATAMQRRASLLCSVGRTKGLSLEMLRRTRASECRAGSSHCSIELRAMWVGRCEVLDRDGRVLRVFEKLWLLCRGSSKNAPRQGNVQKNARHYRAAAQDDSRRIHVTRQSLPWGPSSVRSKE